MSVVVVTEERITGVFDGETIVHQFERITNNKGEDYISTYCGRGYRFVPKERGPPSLEAVTCLTCLAHYTHNKENLHEQE